MRTSAYGVALAAAMIFSAGATATAATQDGNYVRAADPAYKVLVLLKYKGPGNAALRAGTYNASTGGGWGWNKVKKKHKITKYSALEYVTKGPNREHQGGTTYRSHAYAGKYRCTNGRCTLIKQYKVYVAVNEKKLGDNRNRGVITAYCEGVTRCPAWVSTTLSKLNAQSAGSEQFVPSYEPLTQQYRSAQEI
ncbi:hypothetical protein AB0P17_01270 [Streptomyces sp. NPDC088124]|uniref:hypothetical protein n=1 Tax=Streptomyces sp. NPDC088124 TaxID=3154654 RepID=UPI0034316D1C